VNRLLWRWGWLALCGVALAACAAAGGGRPDWPMVQIACGGQSGSAGVAPGFAVYADESSFAAAFAAIHAGELPSPPVPGVDFDRWLVAAGFLGQHPTAGYGIDLASARVEGDRLVVTVVRRAPPAGAITAQVITTPYCLVRLARGGGRTVRFVDEAGQRLAELPLQAP